MTDFGDEMRDLAAELLDEEFGITMTYQTSVIGAFDPATQKATETLTSITITGSPFFPFDDHFVDGDIVRRKDVQTIVAERDLTFTPELNGVIILNSVTYRIVRIFPIYSDDREAAWKLHLRAK